MPPLPNLRVEDLRHYPAVLEQVVTGGRRFWTVRQRALSCQSEQTTDRAMRVDVEYRFGMIRHILSSRPPKSTAQLRGITPKSERHCLKDCCCVEVALSIASLIIRKL